MSVLIERSCIDPSERILCWYCPGCNCNHGVRIAPRSSGGGDVWSYNGNDKAPTFVPSILSTRAAGEVCHVYIKDGKIQYLNDCTHSLAGKTVSMVDKYY